MHNQRIPTIKNWMEQDRPREKFIIETGMNLTNAELIAILIGSGNKEESAVHLAHRILESIDGDLDRLAELSVQDLSRFKGIGMAKAVSIAAAVELCYNRMSGKNATKFNAKNTAEAYQMIKEELAQETAASWWVFLFSGSGLLLHKHQIAFTQDGFCDPRSILQVALGYQSESLMLVRCSETIYSDPLNEDINYVVSLIESAGMLSIRILDQLVLHPEGYYSFRDSGII